jgi:hypothetical protein
MNIALDFDETYTLDPDLWNMFCKTCITRGHNVWCVTFRHESEGLEVLQSIGKVIGVHNVIFTGRKAKRRFCEDMSVYIDVWIDDTPDYIISGYGT